MHIARLTVELLRPVPLTPLTIALAWPGKKVQLVSAALHAGEVEVARALALRIRRRDLPLPADLPPEQSPPPGPDVGTFEQPPWGDGLAHPSFHSDAVDHRFVAGGFERPGLAPIGSACASRSSPASLRQRHQLGAVAPRRLAAHQPRSDDLRAPPVRGRVGLSRGRHPRRWPRRGIAGEPPVGPAGIHRASGAEFAARAGVKGRSTRPTISAGSLRRRFVGRHAPSSIRGPRCDAREELNSSSVAPSHR